MTTSLTITGVTRMKNSKVCISGATDNGEFIRPVLPGGIDEHWLTISEHNEFGEYEPKVIRPFAKIEVLLADTKIIHPHTEDKSLSPQQVVYKGLLPQAERESFLDRISDACVSEIFGAEIHHHKESSYVQKGEGERSLGTVKAKEVKYVSVLDKNNGCKCRLKFTDMNDGYYNLPVKDLSLLNYLHYLRTMDGLACGTIGSSLQAEFNNAKTYIRIGLGRGYHSNQEKEQNRCYLLISGVYTFPDYLSGRCFSDFKVPINDTIENDDDNDDDEISF